MNNLWGWPLTTPGNGPADHSFRGTGISDHGHGLSKCESTFAKALQCPSCQVRLQYQMGPRLGGSGGASTAGSEPSRWQHTPWGRIFIGLLLTQGLSYGLQLLCTAGLLATDEEAPKAVWATLLGLVLLQAFQGISLIIGGALAGAGQFRGFFLGPLLGLAHTAVWMLVQVFQHQPVTMVNLYAQLLLPLAFGALGGLLGSIIWRPLPIVTVPLAATPKSKDKVPVPGLKVLKGPIAWGRAAAGTIIVMAGLFWPKFILDFLVNASKGQLTLQSQMQAQLITWEIIGLITLFGAALAGATTRNGLKQGMCVGLVASILIIGSHLGSRTVVLEQTIILVITLFTLTLIGAWFGGQLFPPLQDYRRRRPA